MITRDFEENDCKEVVNIHLRSFQGFFLTFMGASFLTLLYRATIADPSGIAIIAEKENKTTGFVTGTSQPSGFYKRLLKKHILGFGVASLQSFFRKPSILPRLLRAFSMPGQPLPSKNCATLMSIAVDPDCQNLGIGKLLVNAFIEEARSRGSQFVNLTTDAVNNEAANHFYKSLGFELFRNYTTPEGRIMNEYLIKTG